MCIPLYYDYKEPVKKIADHRLLAVNTQVNHKTRYRVLYAIAIIMLLAVIPISEYMACLLYTSSVKQKLTPDRHWLSLTLRV